MIHDEVRAECERQKDDLLGFLRKILAIDSYTFNFENVAKVNAIVAEELKSLGFHTEVIPSDSALTTIVAENSPDADLLLIGHTDVAHEFLGTESLDLDEKGFLHYPGCGDMKGGVALMIYALKALKALGKLPETLRVVVVPDEERATLVGKKYLAENARKSKLCLSFEPARMTGAIVSSRKGGSYYELEVFGRAAHAGVDPERGINAIEDLAQKITKLHALNNFESGTLVNVGFISGGTDLANSISEHARMKVSVKYKSAAQRDLILPQIEKICTTPDVSGITLKLTKSPAFFEPAEKTEQTEKAVSLIKAEAKKLGIDLLDVHTGGDGDIGFVAAEGTPAVCGMGPIGGSLHSPEEFMDFHTMPERTALAALSILALSEKFSG